MDKQPNSRSCFLCGRQNDIGLKIFWYNDHEAQQVKAQVTIPDHFNSYPGIVHGGIVAALLDETAGRAILMDDKDLLMVTTRLEVKYRLPTPTGEVLTLVGWAIKKRKRYAQVAGEVRLADGTVTARCEATIALPAADFYQLSNWQEEGKYWKVYED